MEAKAYLYDLRISPRKVSIVLDLIRNKDVATAAGILANTRKAASEPVAKLLKSAVANAVERTLTCMAERGVSEVMTECNRLSQRLVKSEADRNSPRNLSDLKGVGQSSSVVITLR